MMKNEEKVAFEQISAPLWTSAVTQINESCVSLLCVTMNQITTVEERNVLTQEQ